jgi:hypothetical protein
VGQLFPLYELKTLIGSPPLTEEKIVRVRQFRYFQKKRDNRFDFLELGVLEKFPYPLPNKETALAD